VTMEPAGVSPAGPAAAATSPACVVVTGNPNCGKTTVFNALTGLRAKVGNYAGVTVERKEGRLQGAPAGREIRVLDLPGSYSLIPQSLDEQVARDILLERLPEVPAPDVIVVVVDASNLERNLYFATQVIELGYPTLVALNMMDVAASLGHVIDSDSLSRSLGAPVVPLVASSGKGVIELRRQILSALARPASTVSRQFCQLPPAFQQETTALARLLDASQAATHPHHLAEAQLLLTNERALTSSAQHYPPPVADAVLAAHRRLEAAGVDWRSAAIESRYATVAALARAAITEAGPGGETFSDRLDRVLTHNVWGTLIFLGLMGLLFQGIFSLAPIPMEAIQGAVDWLGGAVGKLLPPGDLNSLLVNGVIAGVGAVVVFLPQILLLFLFIGFLEDTGYMARAAFLMDRVMSKVGLHGKSFIPLLGSFACAIPGIMATRTIESPRDRLVTTLIAPLMSCSARLPVYTLLIAACIPPQTVLGFIKLPGLTMLGMYLLGVVGALVMAWVFKRFLLKGEPPLLILELPPYKRPLLRQVLRHVWDRAKIFLRQAGTVILGINILLWFLASYPRSATVERDLQVKRAAALAGARAAHLPATNAVFQQHLASLEHEAAGARLRESFAGRLGQAIEPLIQPLGFDWQMGIGIVASFAAREVFVSTMSTVYNVGGTDDDGAMSSLVETLRSQRRPNGQPVYTTLTGLTLMVFYVFALQCVSTIAVVRRETNSWKWPIFQWVYMGLLAWVMAFATRHLGMLFGLH
jgi:ferrous iron transport protein B